LKQKSKTREYIESILSAVLIAMLIRSFAIEAFKIPSASMVPSILIGDHIFVNKFIYGLRIPFTKIRFLDFRQPKRGEVIVFLYPLDESVDYIKRVVGLPGDRIRTQGTDLFVNGEKVEHTPLDVSINPEDHSRLTVANNTNWSWVPRENNWQDLSYMDELLGDVHHLTQYEPYRAYPDQEYVVPEGTLMMMGDNRDRSSDSRDWGFMPMENVKGRAMFVWLSCGLPEKPMTGPIESIREFLSPMLPCDGHWLSIRWRRFGHWVK